MRIFLSAIIAGTIALMAAPASSAEQPQSECKGLEQSACAGRERCSWVKAHKRIKGKEVAAFCRKKPERRKAVEAKAAPNG
jgi:hypothetical protein